MRNLFLLGRNVVVAEVKQQRMALRIFVTLDFTDQNQMIAAVMLLRQPAFELHIGDLDSFTSAAFLAVQEHGHLDRLRDTLAGLAPEVRQAPYAPHLTVGLYRRAVARAISDLRAPIRSPPTCATGSRVFTPSRTKRNAGVPTSTDAAPSTYRQAKMGR